MGLFRRKLCSAYSVCKDCKVHFEPRVWDSETGDLCHTHREQFNNEKYSEMFVIAYAVNNIKLLKADAHKWLNKEVGFKEYQLKRWKKIP